MDAEMNGSNQWLAYLNADEQSQLAQIDKKMRELVEMRDTLAMQRKRLKMRAAKRASKVQAAA
jgi:hypothetical protein